MKKLFFYILISAFSLSSYATSGQCFVNNLEPAASQNVSIGTAEYYLFLGYNISAKNADGVKELAGLSYKASSCGCTIIWYGDSDFKGTCTEMS